MTGTPVMISSTDNKKTKARKAVKALVLNKPTEIVAETVAEGGSEGGAHTVSETVAETVAETKPKKRVRKVKAEVPVETVTEGGTEIVSEVVTKKKGGGRTKKLEKKLEAEVLTEVDDETVGEVLAEVGQEDIGELGDGLGDGGPKRLPAKYNRLLVFGFWLIENLHKHSADAFNRDSAFAFLQVLSSVSSQVSLFESFESDFKSSHKLLKLFIRQHRTPKLTKHTLKHYPTRKHTITYSHSLLRDIISEVNSEN